MTINLDKLNATANGTNSGKGFTPKVKGDSTTESHTEAPTQSASNTIPHRCNALALSAQSHEAMSTLHGAGLQNAAAYVKRKQTERNAVVEKVSDAIAYLSDPDLLEADIMSAAAAKVAARSDAWGYSEPVVDFDNLFALPASSQRMLNGV